MIFVPLYSFFCRMYITLVHLASFTCSNIQIITYIFFKRRKRVKGIGSCSVVYHGPWKCIFSAKNQKFKLKGWLLMRGAEGAVADFSWTSDSKTWVRQFILWVSFAQTSTCRGGGRRYHLKGLSRYNRGFLPHTTENCWCREESLREEVLHSLTKDWWYPVLVGKLDFYYYVTVMGLPNLFLRKDSFNF